MSAKAAKRVVKQLAGSGTGQSLMDRVTQAKYSLAGSGLGKAVAKASTEEIGSPKRKHLDYLISCSNEPNVSIPLLAGLLVERIQDKSWVVVFKGLITTHNLMNFGNEKFSHYLASNSCSLSLENFNDKTSPQSYEMSLFIRRYSRYVNEKSSSYRAMAFDFCKVKRGREDGVLRTMPIDKLLKALPVLSSQISVLLEFDAQEKDLNNPVILAAFLLLYKDLVRLFASYNEGMINLIEHYFTLQLSQCRLGLDLYNSFPAVQARLTEFLTVAETMGIGEKDSLGLQPVPAKVIQAMEQHLAILEKKKGKVDEDEEAGPSKAGPQRPLASPGGLSRPKPPAPVARPVSNAPALAGEAPPTSQTEVGTPVPASPPRQANEDETGGTPMVVVLAPESQDEPKEEEEGEECVDGEASQRLEEHASEVESRLPPELQREAIAAATSMFTDSLVKSNAAVLRSTEQRNISAVSSVHTQLGRHEQHTVVVNASSRSPSPARPKPPAAGKEDAASRPQPKVVVGGEASVSDGELDSQEARVGRLKASTGSSLSRHESVVPSTLALNENQLTDGSRSLLCSSPFADDEALAEPVIGDPAWPTTSEGANGERPEFTATFAHAAPALEPSPLSANAKASRVEAAPSNPQATVAPTVPSAGASSALDDLLGLDLLAGDFHKDEEGGGPAIQPTLVPTAGCESTAACGAWQASAAAPATAAAKPAGLDDDLLSLDPLLNPKASEPIAPATPMVSAKLADPDQLPAGLKKVSSNVPIRPAFTQQQQKKKDPLDALDSTLANLASSLGGQEKSWGAGSSKPRP